MILPRESWPEALKHEAVEGVWVGGCVTHRKFPENTAHAHLPTKENMGLGGWLCFSSEEALQNRAVQIHELAHLVAPKGHGKLWRKAVLALGGTLEEVPGFMKSYEKKSRRPSFRVSYNDQIVKIGYMGQEREGLRAGAQALLDNWLGQPTTASEKA